MQTKLVVFGIAAGSRPRPHSERRKQKLRGCGDRHWPTESGFSLANLMTLLAMCRRPDGIALASRVTMGRALHIRQRKTPMTDYTALVEQLRKWSRLGYNLDQAAEAIATLERENQAYRDRLELTGDFADGPDGIECRDDTIKLLDARIATLEKQIAEARGLLDEAHDALNFQPYRSERSKICAAKIEATLAKAKPAAADGGEG